MKKPAQSLNPSGKNSPLDFQRKLNLNDPIPAEDKQPKLISKEGKNCIRKFAFATRVGFHPNNPHKVNQDSYILVPNLQNLQSLHMFGICDGHGQYGRDVSQFVKIALPLAIKERYNKLTQNLSMEEDNYKSTDPKAKNDPYYVTKQQIRKSFLQVNKDIENNVQNC